MALADIQDLLRVPASLYVDPVNPDSLTEADWGTQLGVHENVAVTLALVEDLYMNVITGAPSQKIRMSEVITVAVLLKSFDPDLLEMAFPEVASTVTSSGKPKITGRATRLAGKRMTDYGRVLLVKPKDPDIHPGLYLYNATATVEQTPQDFQVEVAWQKSVVFMGFPNASKLIWDYCHLQDVGA